MLLLPITRPWTREAVCAAIAASDIPRGRCVLVLDAPDCEDWIGSLAALGFEVEAYITGKDVPPDGNPVVRRERQTQMREFTLPLVDEDEEVLCLDDDAIVPPDVYRRLSAIGPHATGVQATRYDPNHTDGLYCGVYRNGAALKRGVGVESVTSCGHYCLLTTGAMYRRCAVALPGRGDMQPIAGLRVDWGCVVGHLTERGVLWP